jgi:predicted Co/Zn/Cd cation transporter (cation efflux family)
MLTVHRLTVMFNTKKSVHEKIVLKLSVFVLVLFMCFGLCLAIIRKSSANSPVSENGSVERFLA